MKRKLLTLVLFIILLNFNNISFAGNNIDPKLEQAYDAIILKLKDKYNRDSQKEILNTINLKIEKILENNNLVDNKRKLINDLFKLINESLYKIYLDEISLNTKQKILERQYIYSLNKSLKSPIIPNYIEGFASSNRKIINTNDKYEFISGDSIKKIYFSKYYELDSKTYKGLEGKNGYILYINGLNKFIFVENYEIIAKIPYSEASKYFKFSSTDKNNIFEDTLSFYTYNVPNYLFIEDKYGFYLDSLNKVGINNEEYGIHRNNSGKYTFIKNYTKVNLINKDILFGITEKEKFLDNITNDKKILVSETNKEFSKLKKITEELTFGLSKKEKIDTIYAWILDNIEYSTNFSLDDYKIYSGILTYTNKNGVCEGYVKLMAYMLNFAGVKDVEVLRGKVIDAQDFPEVGHAWLKVGDLYYDPTFDDPIGAKVSRTINQYKYYALPKDLFYTNRYDLNLTPKELEATNMNYRKALISKNLYALSDKYENSNYLLLEDSSFRKKHSFSPDEKITINKLLDVLPVYEVNNYIFTLDGTKKHITNINYFTVDDNNINLILSQINFDLDSRYFFKWKNQDGSYKYIISDTITLN